RGGVAINGERPDETGAMKLFDEVYKPTPADRTYFKDEALSSTEYEARQWIQAVVEDLDPIVLPEQAAVVTEIIEAIYKSGRTGRTVIFD
ncbi:MAG: gfo/Idh/MocA family oxidoreductase, partial [Clostridia bacterium]|nr:gfo/Idh/MocA family oxidoreductase [Clostridia bacterium]